MALDTIQTSPFAYYPTVAPEGGGNAAAFSSGYESEQKRTANAMAMDAARQQEIMNQQAMRLKDAEEARKQALFKQGMANVARVNSAYSGSSMPSFNMPAAPAGGAGLMPPAGAGPQAAAEPQAGSAAVASAGLPTGEPGSQKPTWYNPETAAGYRGTAQYAQNTTVANDASAEPIQGQPVPYQRVDQNVPAQVSRNQANIRQQEIFTDVTNIPRNIASGQYTGMPLAPDAYREPRQYTEAQLAERTATRADMQKMVDFYSRPDVQQYLQSDPALARYASQNPVQFYQQNSASMAQTSPQAGLAAGYKAALPNGAPADVTNFSVEGADGKPIQMKLKTGTSEIPVPDTTHYLLEPASIGVQRQQMADGAKLLQAQWKRAQALHDNATMTDVENKLMALRASSNLLNGVEAITELNAGRPQAVANLLNQMSGGRLKLQERGDGTYNVYDGNKMTQQGVTKDQLVAQSRMIFDQQYQTQVAAAVEAKKARELKIFEAEVAGLKKTLEETATLTKDIYVKKVEAALKNVNPEVASVVPTPDGTGLMTTFKNGTTQYISTEPLTVNGKPMMMSDGKTPVRVPVITQGTRY